MRMNEKKMKEREEEDEDKKTRLFILVRSLIHWINYASFGTCRKQWREGRISSECYRVMPTTDKQAMMVYCRAACHGLCSGTYLYHILYTQLLFKY